MIIILTGLIATGKSTLAKALAEKTGWTIFKSSDALKERMPTDMPKTRESLQAFGAKLDAETEFRWVGAAVLECGGPVTIVDAVRRPEQIEVLRNIGEQVVHVHLEASGTDLADRYHERRGGDVDEALDEHNKAKHDPIEAKVPGLRNQADLVVNTSRCTPEDVVVRVWALLEDFFGGERFEPLVDVIVGGQYGSEGKGHVVSHIAREYDVLLRVGGPNAGHTVLDPKTNEKVSFYHLPSGALHAPAAKLVLGPGACINPVVLAKEAEHIGGLDQLAERLFIDPQANIITDGDIADEAGLVRGIGSTGQGVGYATAKKIVDRGTRKLARDHEAFKPFLFPTLELLDSSYGAGERILLEGTQGTGLSLHHGHYPYVTSRDTAASGTAGEAGIAPRRIRRSIVVIRTNPIRVQSPQDGTSGPIGRELSWEDVAERAGVDPRDLRKREMTTTTKRLRRVAEFGWADLRRACLLNSPTDLALTFVDYITPQNADARRFVQLSPQTIEFITEIERVARAPVSLITTRFHKRSIIDRRTW